MQILYRLVCLTVLIFCSMFVRADSGYGMDQAMRLFALKDYDSAYKLSLTQAQQNNKEAQRMLGHLYKNGLGVSQNFEQSMRWYLKAAKQGSGDAQFNLGRMYLYGLGTDKNFSLAAGWFERAIESGEVRAYGTLASLYEYGRGVEKDLVKAQELYLKDGSAWALARYQSIQSVPCQLQNHTQLFNVILKCANRQELRNALSHFSILKRYENDQSRGDIYVSNDLMSEAKELRVAYSAKDEFASAKFVFNGRLDTAMITRVKAQVEKQYGIPNQSYGQPDQGKVLYKWVFDDGIELNVYRDWPDATTYLSYTYPERRNALLKQRSAMVNPMR